MKVYDKIEDMFEDKIISKSDILVLWGKRGYGKSSLAGKFMSEFMRPEIAREFIMKSELLCNELKKADIFVSPMKDHLVFCDTFFENTGYMRKKTTAYRFSALNFGLPSENHPEALPLTPFAQYFFDEMQDVFDSHIAALPTFLTKAFELARQIGIFICMTMQRPMRLHKDIRELATFIECTGVKVKKNKYGRTVSCEWLCNIIYDNTKLEEYLKNKNPSLIDKKVKFVFQGDIFKCYDSNYFAPLFYKGFENNYYFYDKTERTEFSKESFAQFYKHKTIDIPENFKGKTRKKEKKEKDDGKGREKPRDSKDD